MEALAGKVAVVTGAASGLGLAMARRFASEGAAVVLADIDEGALGVAAEQMAGASGVLAVRADVADPDAVDDLARRTVERFGAVHVVCNNAGTVAAGRAWEISLADWQRVLGANLWGVINGIRTFVPILLAQGEAAHVVNTASMAGVTSLPTLGPYVTSKHGVVALSEVLHHDLAAIGAPIGVSVLCPGFVPTHLGQDDKLSPVADQAPGAVTADDVAGHVRAAMSDGRFYVFTHPGSTREVEQRGAAIVDGMAPALRPLPRT